MHLALIPPNSMLQQISNQQVTLLLPYQLRMLPAAFALEVPGYRILDNGAAEGAMWSVGQLLELVDMYFIDELVLPDVMGDAEATRKLIEEWAPIIREKRPELKLMAVCHGTSSSRLYENFQWMLYNKYIDTIGLPRILCHSLPKRIRVTMLEWYRRETDMPKPIHCLGAYYGWPGEIIEIARTEAARSMDSSLPFVTGLAGFKIMPDEQFVVRRPERYLHVVPSAHEEVLINDNCNVYRRWATGHPSAS